MSIASMLMNRLLSCLHSLIVCFKRVLCFLRPRTSIQHRSDNELPYTIAPVYHRTDDASSKRPFDNNTDRSWNSDWMSKPLAEPIEEKINEYRRKMIEDVTPATNSANYEPDYFNDMAPSSVKTRKALLRDKRDAADRSQRLFAVSADDIPISDELGDLQDAPDVNSWNEVIVDDDVDSVLKAQKHRQRQERHDQRRLEHNNRRRDSAATSTIVRLSID